MVDYGSLIAGHQFEPATSDGGRRFPFRFVICIIVLSAVAMNSYTNHSLYISAIKMISTDVLESELTKLRAFHLERDLLASDELNAASPGTCPIETKDNNHLILLTLMQTNPDFNSSNDLYQISQLERLKMETEANLLRKQIDIAVNDGKLVNWSLNQRSYVFLAHSLGSNLIAIPLSRLGLAIGNRRLLLLCIGAASLRGLLLPILISRCTFWLVFLFELLVAAPGQHISSFAYPIAATWLKQSEANALIGLIHMTILAGSSLTDVISTQMLANNISWSWCFYLPGFVLAFLTLAWLIFGSDSPETSKYVLYEEKTLIRKHSVAKKMEFNKKSEFKSNIRCACLNEKCPARTIVRRPNWGSIFRCKTIWAIIAVSFAYNWNSKLSTLWPTFLANIIHMEAQTIGYVTGFRGAVAILFGSLFALTTRKLAIERPFNISLTTYRHVGQILATLTLAVTVILMVLFDCNFWANLFSIMLTPLISCFNSISIDQMTLDIASEDSAFLLAYIHSFAIGNIIALPVSSFISSQGIDPHIGDRETWRLVWILGLVIKIIACIWFVFQARVDQCTDYSRLEASGKCKTLEASVNRSDDEDTKLLISEN